MYKILLVEDDDVDVMMIERAFSKANIINPLHRAKDGLDALDCLRGTNGRNKLTRPIVILLDLNMPRLNGAEFLETIKKDKDLKTIPVVVLTSSKNDEDVIKAYDRQVAGYITKPTTDMDELQDKLHTFNKYWTICEL